MPDYRIAWEIDITAASPTAAALKARAIQRKANSTATVFTVADGQGLVKIDLTEVAEAGDAIAFGARFNIFENAHGYRIVRLSDGAECTFYGDDSCERFRYYFHGDENPDDASENASEGDEFGDWCVAEGEIK